MDILPIKSIREEDLPVVGKELVELSRLAQNNVDVADGVAVLPPVMQLQTILNYYNFSDREVFEQSLFLFKDEVLKIPIPEELLKLATIKRVSAQKLWVNLLEEWLAEIRSKIFREGIPVSNQRIELLAKPLFFTSKIKASGDVLYDYEAKGAILEVWEGVLTDQQKEEIAENAKKADKILYIHKLYKWIVEGKKIKIVKVLPFTQYPVKAAVVSDLPIQKPQSGGEKAFQKSTLKVFSVLAENFVIEKDADGVLICAEKFGKNENPRENFEEKAFALVESASSFAAKPVIFKLSDKKQRGGGVRGALELIHGHGLLKEEVEAFLFARHKKGLLNTQIAIPFVRSVNEFLQLKRDLATLGVSRKGSLKLWMEVAVPENVSNLEEYLNSGLDGIILNLDELARWMGGFDPSEPESDFYQKQVSALLKFLEDGLKILHRANIPVIALGSLALHDDVLSFLIEKGVWGLSFEVTDLASLHLRVRELERQTLRQRLAHSA